VEKNEAAHFSCPGWPARWFRSSSPILNRRRPARQRSPLARSLSFKERWHAQANVCMAMPRREGGKRRGGDTWVREWVQVGARMPGDRGHDSLPLLSGGMWAEAAAALPPWPRRGGLIAGGPAPPSPSCVCGSCLPQKEISAFPTLFPCFPSRGLGNSNTGRQARRQQLKYSAPKEERKSRKVRQRAQHDACGEWYALPFIISDCLVGGLTRAVDRDTVPQRTY
jgi:hypothetical protein